MDPQPRSTDWRSILLLIFSLSGTLLAFSAGIGLLIFTSLNESILLEANTSRLVTILTASTLIAIGLLLLPVAWLSVKRLRGVEFETFSLPALRPWTWITLLGLWVLILILATLFHDAPGASVFTPFLHFFAIALPVYLIIRVFINRIPLGSSQRAWGVFGSGLTLSPLLAVIAEGVVIVFGLIVFGVYMGLNPDRMFDFERLIQQIEQAPDLESLVFLIGPWLKNPLTLLGALTLLSVFVPIIEEISKIDRGLAGRRPAQHSCTGICAGHLERRRICPVRKPFCQCDRR